MKEREKEGEHSEEEEAEEQEIDRQHNRPMLYRQVPLQSTNYALPHQFNQNINPNFKFGRNMMKENTVQTQILDHKLFEEQPRPKGRGDGVYMYNFHQFSRMLIDYIFVERQLEQAKV